MWQYFVTLPGFGSISGSQEMLLVMCCETLGNLIDFSLFSHLQNGNNYTHLLSIVFGIWKIRSLSLILRELWLLLGSLNKNTIFRNEELATDLVESGWMKHSWLTLQVWPHNFPFALSGNKPIPVLSVAEQIFIISMGIIQYIELKYILCRQLFCSHLYNTKWWSPIWNVKQDSIELAFLICS